MLELLKVLVCMPFLLYSCYSDIKTRRVSNTVWPVMLAAGLPFIIYDLLTCGFPYFVHMVLSFAFIFGFVYILFQLNAFGGADAKIMMVISIIFPVFPVIHIFDQILPLQGIPLINLFAFSVFSNSVLLTIIVPIGLFLYNLAHVPIREMPKKLGYMFVGYKSKVFDLKDRHIRLMDVYERTDKGVVSHFTRGGTELDNDVVHELEEYVEKGFIDEKVWITPGLPFMIPITAGFITAVVFGDLIFYFTLKYLVM
ncbi:MAG: A24 family peptidase C-terminal domain-containing protein [Methanosarcinaceae archaeon]|nr:prepilin peptidase [Methanosarcinaceae archaeon]MDF1533922.1 A24 family peptidase C-terminal domain-containing protein [Methanosarcinaceae archaeon]